MPAIARYVLWRVLPLCLAGVLLFGYTCLHFVGLMILMNRITGVVGFTMFLAPVFAFPIYLVSYWSLSKASILLWVELLIVHTSYVLAGWPGLTAILEPLRLDWPLIVGATLLWLTGKKWEASTLRRSEIRSEG